MRKIIYMRLNTGSIEEELLEACSDHSSILEPIGEQELLLDLSLFKRISDILRDLAEALAANTRGGASVGLATSPLLAMLAANRSSLHGTSPGSYRRFQQQGAEIIQVLPGKEAVFLLDLPVEEFFPLSCQESRLLQRLGYMQVGELAALGPLRLQQILKRNPASLWQNIQGRDYRPVRGLYPPERLAYSLELPEGCADRNQLLLILEDSARELGAILGQRHAACQQVKLQLEMEAEQPLNLERRLARACHDMSRLGLIMAGLLPAALEQPITGLRVSLEGLQPLEMRNQNLFTLRSIRQDEARQQRRAAIMEQLLQRFPDSIGMGLAIERREEILRFWDPWRFASPGGLE